jgi:hypothetical protein
LKIHTNDHLRDRWSYFSWFGFRDVNKSGKLSEKQAPESEIKTPYTDALNEIEGILIEALEPRLNKQGARWIAREYVQHSENDEDKISKIYEMVESLTQKPRPLRS